MIDFKADQLEAGIGFKIAAMIDKNTRLILDDTVGLSITGEDLVWVLERQSLTPGLLRSCASTTDRKSPAVGWRNCLKESWIDVHLTGEVWKGWHVELLHARVREESLNVTPFPSLLRVHTKPTYLHLEHNRLRLHSGFGDQAPSRCAERCIRTKPDRLAIKRDSNRG